MDTLCVWIRNYLQSAEPRRGMSTAAAWTNRLHHSSRKDPRRLCGSTEGALWEHHGTGVCSSGRSFLATHSCHGTSQPLGKLGCCRLCHWHWFSPCYLTFLRWLFYPLPLTVASGRILSLLGLDTASVWTGQRPPVLQLMEANENNKPQWHGAPLLLERAERWKSIR